MNASMQTALYREALAMSAVNSKLTDSREILMSHPL